MTNNNNHEDNLDQALNDMADALLEGIIGALSKEELVGAEKKGLEDIQDTFTMALAETDREALRELATELSIKLEGYRLIRNVINTDEKPQPKPEASPLANLLSELFRVDPKGFKF